MTMAGHERSDVNRPPLSSPVIVNPKEQKDGKPGINAKKLARQEVQWVLRVVGAAPHKR